MSMVGVRHQMSALAERVAIRRGEASSKAPSDETPDTPHATAAAGQALLEQVLARENMRRAWKRVKSNKGAAGVDGMDIAQTGRYLVTALPTIREQLMAGTYRPSPVRRVGISKPDGSERELGIPTVIDRLIQQALLQVLQPLIDPTFSEHSYGFRPGRRARDAVLAAQRHVQDGYRMLTSRTCGRSMSQIIGQLRRYVPGWKAYFNLAQTPKVWRTLDEWMRHRMRAIQLKQWRRGTTMYRELLKLGAPAKVARLVAADSRRWWHNSAKALNSVLTIAYFDRIGMPRLT